MVTDTRTLTYDNVGRPITLDDNRHDLGFDYNALGNLTDFTAAGSAPLTSQDYTYDENANRETLVQNSTTYTYSLGVNNNRLTSTTGPTAKTYTYDAAGNVTSDNIHDYAYDDRGRLTDVDSGTVTYAHNGQGQRVKKDDGTVTLFAYDEAGQLLGEYDSLGNAIQEHVWFDGAPVAVLTGTDEYYVHTDHLGTPRIVTDGNTAIWRWESNPFGENAAQEDPDGDLTTFTYNLRFPGQYYDDETGLHYNYFRTYDPETGRYLESDPIGLGGGLNTYGYVNANPNSFVDPYGLFMTSVDAACTVDPFICAEVMGDISRIPQNLADAHGICIDAKNVDDLFEVVESVPGLGEAAAAAALIAAVKKGRKPSDDNFVFRALRRDENPALGLRARSPGANTKVGSHVMGKRDSDLISTTRRQDLALDKFNSGNGVVAIDLRKVNGPIIDVSHGVGRGRVYTRTKGHQEVLIRDPGGNIPAIPPEAIRVIQ